MSLVALEAGDGALAEERVDQHIRSAHAVLPFPDEA